MARGHAPGDERRLLRAHHRRRPAPPQEPQLVRLLASPVAAARALASKLAWSGPWFGGGLGAGYVFVQGDGPSGMRPAFEVEA